MLLVLGEVRPARVAEGTWPIRSRAPPLRFRLLAVEAPSYGFHALVVDNLVGGLGFALVLLRLPSLHHHLLRVG